MISHLSMGLYIIYYVFRFNTSFMEWRGKISERTSLMHLTTSLRAWWTSFRRRKASLDSFWLSFYIRQRQVLLSSSVYFLSYLDLYSSFSPLCLTTISFFSSVHSFNLLYSFLFPLFPVLFSSPFLNFFLSFHLQCPFSPVPPALLSFCFITPHLSLTFLPFSSIIYVISSVLYSPILFSLDTVSILWLNKF